MSKPNEVEHRLLRVLWSASGDKARYQCSCGHDGPWCRGAPSNAHDRRPFKTAATEAYELHADHIKIKYHGTPRTQEKTTSTKGAP